MGFFKEKFSIFSGGNKPKAIIITLDDIDDDVEEILPKKKRKPGNFGGKKTGKKRRIDTNSMSGHNHQLTSGFENLTSANSTSSIYSAISQSLDSLIKPKTSLTSEQDLTRSSGSEKPLNISNISSNILEISPFERNLTYKCSSCSKRTNCLGTIHILRNHY